MPFTSPQSWFRQWPYQLIISTAALDLISKWLIRKWIFLGEGGVDWFGYLRDGKFSAAYLPREAWLPFVNIVHVWNRGVSFGLLASHYWWKPLALAVMTGFIVVLLLRWLQQNPDKLTRVALALIIGGALGNMLDRLAFGAVYDFIDVHLQAWPTLCRNVQENWGYACHWPAFNLADSFIFVGAVLFLISSFRARPKAS